MGTDAFYNISAYIHKIHIIKSETCVKIILAQSLILSNYPNKQTLKCPSYIK